MNIRLLDCTLRDGGYVNDWNFGEKGIKRIVENLILSNIEIVEVGFLDQRVEKDSNKTIKSDMLDYNDLLCDIDKKNSKLVAMIEYGTYDIDKIIDKKDSILDGIRVIFTKNKIKDAISFCDEVVRKGYMVFANPIKITDYNDKDLKELFDYINNSKVSGTTIVDTYGYFSPKEAMDIYKKFDSNINKELSIGFHAHNTLQMAMGNCCAIVDNVSSDRLTYIDCTLSGMGKGSGNAYTEILVNYMNKNGKCYNLNYIVDILENEISKIKERYSWDYSLNRFVSFIDNMYYKYVDYYKNVKKLSFSEIKKVESTIDNDDKFSYSVDKADYYLSKYLDNNRYDAVIFDLDGTILDTTEGILNSIDYVIDKMSLDKLSYNSKLKFIGLPIQESFRNTFNLDDEDVNKAVRIFRERYKTSEIFRAKLYDGIIELFSELAKRNIKIGVATYKREDLTLELLEYFDISKYCSSIHGSDYDGFLSKNDIINNVVMELNVNDKKRIVMIGDCKGDYDGALSNGLDFIGVTYGFGFKGKEKKINLANNVEDIKKYII